MRTPFSAFFQLTALAILASLLGGCAVTHSLFTSGSQDMQEIVAENSGVQSTHQKRFLGIFSPYRIDVQQGNFVSREMVAQLKEKMNSPEGVSRAQVRFVMGTPLVDDMFHKDRWDYVFRLQKSNGEILSSKIVVTFNDDKLADIQGGDLPTENDYLSLIAGTTPTSPTKK